LVTKFVKHLSIHWGQVGWFTWLTGIRSYCEATQPNLRIRAFDEPDLPSGADAMLRQGIMQRVMVLPIVSMSIEVLHVRGRTGLTPEK
jgi:hypothetical protein